MGGVIGLTAVLSLFVGLTLGWYLRRANTWCPQCGHSLTCAVCGHRPADRPPAGSVPSQRTASS